MSQARKKVIIIGAGIAGLSAARRLTKKGFSPIILEAQEKPGGRVRSNRSLGFVYEEGANWIHKPKGNPIKKLAEKSGAHTFPTDDDNFRIFDEDGSEYPVGELTRLEEKYEEILETLKGNKNHSFADVFYHNYPEFKDQRLWTYMLSAYLEFDTGGDIHQLSSLDFYDDEEFKGEDVIITNGYDHITNYLAKGLDIHLNTQVSGIDYSDEIISIQTTNGGYLADMVLVTVPLGILKKGGIQFTPPLPKKHQKAIHRLGMGTVNKFVLLWEEAFWPEDLQHIGFTPRKKGKFNYFLNLKTLTRANALMTFAFGDFAIETEHWSDDQIIAGIMAHLRTIYGNEIPTPKLMQRTKWNENPYTHGSYSFVANGGRSKSYKVFEKSIDNMIFFAGEHTIRDYRGTVHGAYLSGIREAKKIGRILKMNAETERRRGN